MSGLRNISNYNYKNNNKTRKRNNRYFAEKYIKIQGFAQKIKEILTQNAITK